MKTLREIVDEASPDLRGLMVINTTQLTGYVGGIPIVITAVLDNTAVCHFIGKKRDKMVINLKKVLVEEYKVVWTNKSSEERRLYTSRKNHSTHTKGANDLSL